MDTFKDDDPLGDLLSDGDNDSFFEDTKSRRRASLPRTPEKTVQEIFNLGESKPPTKKNASDWLGLESEQSKADVLDILSSPAKTKKSDPLGILSSPVKKTDILRSPSKSAKPDALDLLKSPIKTKKPIKKISFEDEDDILGTLGLGKKGQASKEEEKKADLFESILGPKKESSKLSFDDVLRESKAVKRPDVRPQTSSGIGSSDLPREGRRSRKFSPALDPLGLFSTEPQHQTSNLNVLDVASKESVTTDKTASKGDVTLAQKPKSGDIQVSSTEADLPNWLGGAPKSPKSGTVPTTPEEIKTIFPEPASVVIRNESTVIDAPIANVQAQEDPQMLSSLLTQQKMVQAQVEFQNTAISLQNQESQLLMALQLKKYEDNLSEMQKKQQEMLIKQEQQFNVLLERQFAKQQAIENNMRLQQERINSHIQLLISQSPGGASRLVAEGQDEGETTKADIRHESSKIYENMISMLKQRQHEELFLMEESYKKQLILLEQQVESMESRLREENRIIQEKSEETIKKVQEEQELDIAKYKNKMEEMEREHIKEINQLRENYQRIIDEIKFEHSTVLETLKEVKQSESALLGEASSYSQKLDSSVQALYANSQVLQEVTGRLVKDFDIVNVTREEHLKSKEKEVEMMRVTLQKCRENAENERSQLMSLVRTLETKLAEQNQNAMEERWALQQAAATLSARTTALDRESQFMQTSIEREREQLKTLKESIMAEQEKSMLQLTEEKLALAAERSRLEASVKLNQNYNLQRAKAEVESVMQVAKEATEMTDREREMFFKKQAELETLKRALLDKERKLFAKENELARIAQMAEMRAKEGEKALFDASLIETRYKERMKELQVQMNQIASRERKLAEDKIALSKERLALNTLIKQNKQRGIFHDDVPELDDKKGWESDTSKLAYNTVDPEILRLHLTASDDFEEIFSKGSVNNGE